MQILQCVTHVRSKERQATETSWRNVPTLSSLPNTVLSPRAEQFQRPCLNWNWHSLIPIWTPSPITMNASGRLWQIVLWRGARPGILLQMMLAPSATTDDRPLIKVKVKRLNVELFPHGGCAAHKHSSLNSSSLGEETTRKASQIHPPHNEVS